MSLISPHPNKVGKPEPLLDEAARAYGFEDLAVHVSLSGLWIQ